MTTITIPEIQTTHPTLSAPYLGDLMAQFDHATQHNQSKEVFMSVLEKIKYADNVEAVITVIHQLESSVNGMEASIEIEADGEEITIDGADPMFSEVLSHISPMDCSYCHLTLSRKNLHDYCRLALTTPFIDKNYGLELVEEAVRIVKNIEARPAGWKGDTRA